MDRIKLLSIGFIIFSLLIIAASLRSSPLQDAGAQVAPISTTCTPSPFAGCASRTNMTSTQGTSGTVTQASLTQRLSLTIDKNTYFCGQTASATATVNTNNMNPPVGGVIEFTVLGPAPSNATILTGDSCQGSQQESSCVSWTMVPAGFVGTAVYVFKVPCQPGSYAIVAFALFGPTNGSIDSTGFSVSGNTTVQTSMSSNITSLTFATTPSQSSSGTTGPKCLIATATFGSELSPEVRLLRNIRDGYLMKTKIGSSFMIAFNAWYYSFSPYVAYYLTDHPFARTMMKGAIYPLIGILEISLPILRWVSNSEVGVLIIGIIASGLFGSFYLGLPLGILRRRVLHLNSSTVKTLERTLAFTLLSALVLLLVSQLASLWFLEIISTSMIVLSNLTLCGILMSRAIVRLLQVR